MTFAQDIFSPDDSLRRESLKCTAEKLSELVEQEGVVPAAYLGRYNWVSLERLDVLLWSEL